jgi:hypothetical protein
MIDDRLSEAVMLFTGKGVAKTPQEDRDAVKLRFGREAAVARLAEIDDILRALETFRVDWSNTSLGEAGRLAEVQMQTQFPQLSAPACQALGWLYTWWWK